MTKVRKGYVIMGLMIPLTVKRWGFEHRYLPEMIYKDGEDFVIPFFRDKDHLCKLFDAFCIHADGIGSPYSKNEFRTRVVRFDEDVLCLEFTFPDPEESPLCRNAFLFFTEGFDYMCYYTLEKPKDDDLPEMADDEGDFYFMCACVDGAHFNFGLFQFDPHEALFTFYNMFMCSQYGEEYREALEKCGG